MFFKLCRAKSAAGSRSRVHNLLYNIYKYIHLLSTVSKNSEQLFFGSSVCWRSPAEAVALKSAAPRQRVAGRARYVIRFLSKVGGEASPSLRCLRLCRRPRPLTHPTPTAIFRLFDGTSHSQYQARKLIPPQNMQALVTGATKKQNVSRSGPLKRPRNQA